MATSTLTSKGQVTIPVQVREALGLSAGDRIEFVEVAKGEFAIMAATNTVQKLKGLIQKPARTVSIEEMNTAIASQGSASRRLGSR
jgi:AbrB family looped-hinge helix DNA binding protein